MPSVIGLLEERERVASQRVEVLREEADRVLAELREAERDWERFVVARETVVEVLAGPGGEEKAEEVVAVNTASSHGSSMLRSVVSWREGLEASVLPPEYQRLVTVLAAEGKVLACKELASRLGVDTAVKTKVEGVRSRARRLAGRGWLVRQPSGHFALAPGLRDGGS
ncbi:hypothetical protein [Streptomyces sp. NPDC051561]|uniref:hypothetical protein n=1 Tax=Streptomyces sp. NPDC051561 TaxID=3365658 RepID=UPI0037B1B673